jgi:hypothetical protein
MYCTTDLVIAERKADITQGICGTGKQAYKICDIQKQSNKRVTA